MAIYTNVRVVDKNTGNTILNVDESGFKDSQSRIFRSSLYIRERIAPTPLAAYIWTCLEGVWQVTNVNLKFSVTGGAGTTVDVLVSPGVVAPAGTTQLTAPVSGVGTAPFTNTGTLIASPTLIFPGDSVSRVIAGTVGSVEGLLTVQLKRVS